MHVLLRHSKTGQFYVTTGQWTVFAGSAREFTDIQSAQQFVNVHNLPDMLIVLHYDDPVCDLALPVSPAPASQPRAP